MRIRRKKWTPPPDPPLPSMNKLERETTHGQSKQEKMGVSSITSTKTPQALHYDRCFAVVEENRRIGWPGCKSNKSRDQLEEEGQIDSDPQLNGSVLSNRDKKDNPTQVEAFHGVGGNATKKSKSTPTGSYLMQKSISKSSSSRQVEKCKKEKLVPLKKRGKNYCKTEGMKMKKKVAMVTKVKAGKSKKRSQEDYSEEHKDCGKKKKRKRGNELVEGSRCSRINGKGWRCDQLTLVGYALCQHHLGKKKVKSLSSIDSCNSSVASAAKTGDGCRGRDKSSNKPSGSSSKLLTGKQNQSSKRSQKR